MKNQKVRIISLIIALTLALTLAACGGNPDTPGGGDTQPPSQSGTSAPAITTGSGEASFTIDGEEYVGNYEGEYADGLFSGYGVWEFESWRYEGYWGNGLPNGEGKLTWSTTFGYEDYGMELPGLFTYEGLWVDGFASGTLTETLTVDGTPPDGSDNTHQWIFENVQGGVLPEGVHQCVLCSNEFGARGIRAGEMQGVPPWSWEGQLEQSSDTPPTQSTGGDTPDTTTPAPGADIQDIPDNGTPPTVEPPLESHAGDKGYFYTTTDNYLVFIIDSTDIWSSGLEGQIYELWCFTAEGFSDSVANKFVFDDKNGADAFMAQIDSDDPYTQYIQIDNVVYPYTQIPAADTNKRAILDDINEGQYTYYDSMP